MVALRLPSADLADRIDLFWSARCQPGTSGPAFRELLPASGLSLVIRLSSRGSRMVLIGSATEKASVELAPEAEYVGVHFRTGQAPRLADVSAAELTNRHADILSFGGERAASIADRLASSPDLAARQAVLEDLVRGIPPLVRDERCRQAAALLERHGGRLRVDEWAAEVGLHVRSFERRLVEHLGLPPKRIARLVRLREVLRHLHGGRFETLADLAYACGYADQAHLCRDFKELTGRAPGEKDAFSSRWMAGAPETAVVHRYRP